MKQPLTAEELSDLRSRFSRVAPLSNPLRVAESFLVWNLWIMVLSFLVAFAMLSGTGNEIHMILGTVQLVFGVIGGLLFYRGITLLFRGGKKEVSEVIYLRAFLTDDSSEQTRSWISAGMGSDFRLMGIRAPRKRTSLVSSAFSPVIKGLRYAGSQQFHLEAPGRNWLVRLLASMANARFCFIDVRHITPHVITEVELAMIVFGADRVIFVVGDQSSFEEWAAKIRTMMGADYFSGTSPKLIVWPEKGEPEPERFLGQMNRLVSGIPKEVPKIPDEALVLVRDHIDPKEWKTKFGETEGSGLAISLVVVNLIGILAALAMGEFVSLIGIILAILIIVLFRRAWGRYRKQKIVGKLINPEKTDPENSLGRSWRFVMLPFIIVASLPILASAMMPGLNNIEERAKRTKDMSNIRQILLACRAFAADWEGLYPSFDPDAEGDDANAEFFSSTDAFNVLIPDYIDTEHVFWMQTRHPEKLRPPREDGELEAEENVYGYASGQTDTSFSRSPLVFNGLMDAPGEYGEYHPWLKSKKAIVGYCGGHVAEESLTSAKPGATIRARDYSTDNIFLERAEDGSDEGGFLNTRSDNVLLPW